MNFIDDLVAQVQNKQQIRAKDALRAKSVATTTPDGSGASRTTMPVSDAPAVPFQPRTGTAEPPRIDGDVPKTYAQPQTAAPAFDWSQFQPQAPTTTAPGPTASPAGPSFTGSASPGGFNRNFQAPQLNDQTDPGYQFRIDEGLKGVQNSAAAKGTLLTGGTLKDLLNYGQGAASAEYQNTFNRAATGYGLDQSTSFGNTDRALAANGQNMQAAFGNTDRALAQNQFDQQTAFGNEDRLFGENFSLAQIGANAATGANSNLGQFGANGSDTLTGIGNARASGTVGTANAINGGISNAGDYASLAYMYQKQKSDAAKAAAAGTGDR